MTIRRRHACRPRHPLRSSRAIGAGLQCRDHLVSGSGSGRLKALLKISAAIDAVNEKFGFIANYFVLFAH